MRFNVHHFEVASVISEKSCEPTRVKKGKDREKEKKGKGINIWWR
jgi:hypothetical protein